MNEEQKGSASKTEETDRSLRPALIVSKHTLSEYSISMGHLFVGLADESIQSALVCPADCNVDTVVSPSVEVIRHPAFKLPFMWRQNNKMLVEQLVEFRPTVLHCLCRSKASLTRQLARQLDIPYVLTINSLQSRFSWLGISSRRLAKIIVPAKSIAANITKLHPRLVERIEQINVGTFVAETTGCFRQPSQLASMITAGPLRNAEEFEKLFGAIRHLAIEGYEFMLVVIGTGRAEKQLRKLLSALGLLQIVTIVPKLEPWRSVLGAGDIFIQHAVSTAFNPLLLEAMSVGSAVAGCKGGVDDLIVEGQTAVVFDPDDEISIIGRLKQLLDSRELAQQLAKTAQQNLRENHTVSKMISSTLKVYREAQEIDYCNRP